MSSSPRPLAPNEALLGSLEATVVFPDDINLPPGSTGTAVQANLEHSTLAIFRSGPHAHKATFRTFAVSRNRYIGSGQIRLEYYAADGVYLGYDNLIQAGFRKVRAPDDYTHQWIETAPPIDLTEAFLSNAHFVKLVITDLELDRFGHV